MHGAGILLNDKAMAFAVRIVNLYKWLRDDKREHVLSKQLLRSGTSIGANIAESRAAISRADFVSKLYIAAKECRENPILDRTLIQDRILERKAIHVYKRRFRRNRENPLIYNQKDEAK